MRSNEEIIIDVAQRHVAMAYRDGKDKGWRSGYRWGFVCGGALVLIWRLVGWLP